MPRTGRFSGSSCSPQFTNVAFFDHFTVLNNRQRFHKTSSPVSMAPNVLNCSAISSSQTNSCGVACLPEINAGSPSSPETRCSALPAAFPMPLLPSAGWLWCNLCKYPPSFWRSPVPATPVFRRIFWLASFQRCNKLPGVIQPQRNADAQVFSHIPAG